MFGDNLFHWAIGIGIVVLAAAIAWATLNNRQSRREYRRTEDATREFYQQEDADNKPHDGIERS